MVSVYAEDIDHIDVFGEGQKGRETLRAELARLHAGLLRNSQKQYTLEKIRFLKPDVAAIQVSARGTGGQTLVCHGKTERRLVRSKFHKRRAPRLTVEEVIAIRS
jgi:uncharacterized protein (TIGR02246 family)